MVTLCKLVAYDVDFFGYITYVFENLEEEVIKKTKYIMCIRYPNWNHKDLKLEEVGYLHFEEIRAGVDKWFDGKEMIPYRYNAIQFIKFVDKPEEKDYEYIM